MATRTKKGEIKNDKKQTIKKERNEERKQGRRKYINKEYYK